MGDKPHLSASQINMYLKCPKQYYYAYIRKLKRPPGAALLLGTSFHSAIETNYKQKMDTNEDLPLEDVLDSFSDSFESKKQEEEFVYDELPAPKLKDQGIGLVSVHHKIIAPTVKPLGVEESFNVDVLDDNEEPLDFTLKGFIDLIDDAESGIVISDNKTMGISKPQSFADQNVQLSIYALAYNKQYGILPAGVRLDCAVKSKIPKAYQLHSVRNYNDVKNTEKLIANVGDAIKSGVFFCRPEGWHCTERWCGYYDICRK